MTRLVLTRHGHVDWLAPERFRGGAPLALTDKGQRQAEATAVFIRSAWPEAVAVYTSPMGRGVDTGAAIAAALGAPAEALAGLNDIDYGAWQGLTREEAAARWPAEVETWYRAPHLAVIPQGEMLPELAARVGRAMRFIVSRHEPSATVVVVAHDSVNRTLLCVALGLSLGRYGRFRQEPCALNVLDFADDDFVVRLVNGTEHLAYADIGEPPLTPTHQ
jgi:broad specificity phosphatase PhoE